MDNSVLEIGENLMIASIDISAPKYCSGSIVMCALAKSILSRRSRTIYELGGVLAKIVMNFTTSEHCN